MGPKVTQREFLQQGANWGLAILLFINLYFFFLSKREFCFSFSEKNDSALQPILTVNNHILLIILIFLMTSEKTPKI